MFTDTPLIRDSFGQHYRICAPTGAPAGAKPRDCSDEFMTCQFLKGLDAPFGLWSRILHRYDVSGSGRSGTDGPDESAVAHLLATGRVLIYPVADPAKAAAYSRRATFSKSASAQWRVAAPDAQNTRGQKKHFRSKAEALTFLTALNPGVEQLHAMQQMADATRTSPATIDRVAADLASNKLVVIEEPVQAAATAAQSEKTSEADEPQSGNHAQEPGLGPESITPMPAANDEKEADEEPVCELTKFTLRCDHYGKRGYLLDGMSSEPNLNGTDRVIQVISKKDEPDHINLSFAGSCAHGNDQCPEITINGDTLNETVTASPHNFPVVPSEPTREVNSFTDFLRHYMVPDLGGLDYQTYTVNCNGCADIERHEARIHAFPTFQWGGSVSMGYEDKDKQQHWGIKSSLKGNIGSKHWGFEAGRGYTADDFFPEIRAVIGNVVDRVREIIDASTASLGKQDTENTASDRNQITKSSITWPQVCLGGNVELQEIEKSHKVGIGGEIFLKMDPLLKANWKIDLIDWLVLKRTPYRKFFRRARNRVRKGVGTETVNASADLVVELSIEGALETELKWSKQAANTWKSGESEKAGEASTTLTFGLMAKIHADTCIFFVKVTIGAELHLKGATSESEGIGGVLTLYATTDKGKPRVGGSIKFTGVAIYYAYYAEVSRKEQASDSKAQGRSRDLFNESPELEAKVNEKKLEKLVDILPASEWPKRPGKYPVDSLDL